MPSKYEKVFPRLKKLPIEDMDYQQKIDVVKEEIITADALRGRADEVVNAQIDLCLEDIADKVKEICELLVNAAQGRHHGSVFARYWLQLRRVEDFIDIELKNVRLLLNAYEQLGVEQFEVEALDNVKLDIGRIKTQPEVVIKVHDKDRFRQWCIEADLMRELNMHHGTAQALTRLRLLDGLNEPDGITAYVHTKFTK